MEKEKKEIGKLLELYRNYLTDEIKKEMYVNGADKECIDMFEADEVEEERLYKFLNQLSALKKFVKWLVENDKINKDLISRVLIRAYISPENHVSLECEFYDYYESLLMLLSISDTPIEDLISYLK